MIETWLQTPLGKALLEAEDRLMQGVMEGLFGEVCAQVGVWGAPDQFVRYARTQRAGVVAGASGDGVALVAAPDQLGIADDSVDLLILPHTLDWCEHPHATLREATRVLRSDGELLILAFKPGGLWGLKRLWPGARFPVGTERVVGERQLADWLELLDLRVSARQRYFFKWPSDAGALETSPVWQQWGERFWPELASCYMLRAQKRLRTLIPLRSRWKPHKKVVAGLVKPSIRALDRQRRVVAVPPSSWKRR